MSEFQTLVADVMRSTRLNTDYFAQRVVYRTGKLQLSVTAHVRHNVRMAVDPNTNEEVVIEQIHVELDRNVLTSPPDFHDRILLDGETQAYLYAWSGTHRPSSWKAVFERRRQTSQGV